MLVPAASVNEAGALSVWSRPASVDTLSLGVSPEEVVMMGRRSMFSSEFREQAVELVRATGTTIAEDARDLQINDMTLGNWGTSDRAERGEPDSSGLPPLTLRNAPS